MMTASFNNKSGEKIDLLLNKNPEKPNLIQESQDEILDSK